MSLGCSTFHTDLRFCPRKSFYFCRKEEETILSGVVKSHCALETELVLVEIISKGIFLIGSEITGTLVCTSEGFAISSSTRSSLWTRFSSASRRRSIRRPRRARQPVSAKDCTASRSAWECTRWTLVPSEAQSEGNAARWTFALWGSTWLALQSLRRPPFSRPSVASVDFEWTALRGNILILHRARRGGRLRSMRRRIFLIRRKLMIGQGSKEILVQSTHQSC